MDGSMSRVRIGDGTFRYRARYRDPSGRQHELRFPRKVDAQRWLDEATSALVTRTWTAPERGRLTVAEWAGRWFAAQTGLKPSTHYRYGTLLRAHILPAWGNHRLADVTHADVATWVAQLRQHGSAPGTVRHAHRVFSLLLDLAVRDGRIPRNPAERVPLPRIVRGEPRFLTRDEVEILAEAAGEDGDVIRLLANTGLRFGELAALRVRRVDFLRRRLTIAESATEVAGEPSLRHAEDPPAAHRPASRRARRATRPAMRGQAARRPTRHHAGGYAPASAQLAAHGLEPRRRSRRALGRHPAHGRLARRRQRRPRQERSAHARPRLRGYDPGRLLGPLRQRPGRSGGTDGRRRSSRSRSACGRGVGTAPDRAVSKSRWDTSNTTKHVRALLDAAGLEWAVGHTFRKTAATWLDEVGISGRQVANQLGHAKPSMTMDVYMSRRTVTEQAAAIL